MPDGLATPASLAPIAKLGSFATPGPFAKLASLALASLALLVVTMGTALATDLEGSLTVDGRARTYRLHEPPAAESASAVPLVIVLHGGGGNAENAQRMAQMDEPADRIGFVVAYPNGTGVLRTRLLTWNAWNCCGRAVEDNVDDVGFLRALVAHLARSYRIDARRVYVTGLSNGGMMAYRFGCEASDVVAAIAPVAGALNADTCAATQPVSVIAFHGTADQHVRYEGGTNTKRFPGSKPRSDRPVSHAIALWTRADGCPADAEKRTTGHVTVERHGPCRGGSEVVLYTIEGQGHAWPGGAPGLRSGNVDEPTREIRATDLMVEFFLAHPKP